MVMQSFSMHVKAFAADEDASGSSSLGDFDLSDTCHGQGACGDRVTDVNIACRPTNTEWDGSQACLANSFVFEGTGCGSEVDMDCNDTDTCESLGSFLGLIQ